MAFFDFDGIQKVNKKISTIQNRISEIQHPLNRIKSPFMALLRQKIAPPSQEQSIPSIVNAVSQKYNVDPQLITEVIRAESQFKVNAVSKKGAMGLMQLMPKTAQSLGVKDPFNAFENIDGGVRYLKSLLVQFNGNKKLALAAYNAGPSAVEKHGNKIPPYPETQAYVRRILYTKL